MLTGGQAMSYDDFPALTARQQEVLEFIVEKIKSEGIGGPWREAADRQASGMRRMEKR